MDENQFIEITKKEYEQLIVQANYASNISQLSAGIAHEIRNPLTTIKGFIQLLAPHLTEIGKDEYANIALSEINRVNEMIFQFLNATKPKPTQISYIELNKLIKEVEILYESEAQLRNITIRTDLDPTNPIIYMDDHQLKQVIVNIIKNSIEAMEEPSRLGGHIDIRTEVNEDRVEISIHDNGCGMPSESIEKVFLPYYTTKTNGTGLGLSICKKIIEENSGHIQIHSTPHEGTDFRIDLPLVMEFRHPS